MAGNSSLFVSPRHSEDEEMVDGSDLDEDDDISLTSTIAEDVPENDEYEVKGILAEAERNGKMYYLVEWVGYDILDSTWEPFEHIHKQTLLQWKGTKTRRDHGLERPFNVPQFESSLRKRDDEKERRRRLRKTKRRKAGLPVSDSESESDDEDEDEAEAEDEDVETDNDSTSSFRGSRNNAIDIESDAEDLSREDPKSASLVDNTTERVIRVEPVFRSTLKVTNAGGAAISPGVNASEKAQVVEDEGDEGDEEDEGDEVEHEGKDSSAYAENGSPQVLELETEANDDQDDDGEEDVEKIEGTGEKSAGYVSNASPEVLQLASIAGEEGEEDEEKGEEDEEENETEGEEEDQVREKSPSPVEIDSFQVSELESKRDQDEEVEQAAKESPIHVENSSFEVLESEDDEQDEVEHAAEESTTRVVDASFQALELESEEDEEEEKEEEKEEEIEVETQAGEESPALVGNTSLQVLELESQSEGEQEKEVQQRKSGDSPQARKGLNRLVDSDSDEAMEVFDTVEDIPLAIRRAGITKKRSHAESVDNINSETWETDRSPVKRPRRLFLRGSKSKPTGESESNDSERSRSQESSPERIVITNNDEPRESTKNINAMELPNIAKTSNKKPSVRKGMFASLGLSRPTKEPRVSRQSERLPEVIVNLARGSIKDAEKPSSTGYQGTARRNSALTKGSLDLPASAPPRTQSATRGGLSTRGRSGSGILNFATLHTGPRIAKKRTIETSLMHNPDPDRQKHYGKASTLRKVELAGRAQADADRGKTDQLVSPAEYPNRSVLSRHSSRVEILTAEHSTSEANPTQNQPKEVRWASNLVEIPMEIESIQIESQSSSAEVIQASWAKADEFLAGDPSLRRESHSGGSGKICHYFINNGHCKFGDSCYFRHVQQAEVPVGGLLGGTSKITCVFWALPNKRCNKADGSCKYAHEWTQQISAIPNNYKYNSEAEREADQETIRGLLEWLRSSGNISNSPRRTTNGAESQLQSEPNHSNLPASTVSSDSAMTCFFWAVTGHCTKTAEDCRHLHTWSRSVSYNPSRMRYGSKFEAEEVKRENINRWLHVHPGEPPPPDVLMDNGTKLPLAAPSSASAVMTQLPLTHSKVRPGGDSTVTCYYWGSPDSSITCINADGACSYAHERTGKIMKKTADGYEAVDDVPYLEAEAGRKRRREEEAAKEELKVASMRARAVAELHDIKIPETGIGEDPSLASSITSIDFLSAAPKAFTPSDAGNPIDISETLNVDARSVTKPMIETILCVWFGTDTAHVILRGTEFRGNNSGLEILAAEELRFGKSVIATDFIRQFKGDSRNKMLVSGIIVPAPDETMDLSALAEYLRLSTSGICANARGLTIVVYPSKCDGWKEFGINLDTYQDTDLCFHLLHLHNTYLTETLGSPDHPQTESKALQEPYRVNITTELLGRTVRSLLPKLELGNPTERIVNVYLLFPSKSRHLRDIISEWLYSVYKDAKVFTSDIGGSWLDFCQKAESTAGCIVCHTSMLPIVCRMSFLGKLLLGSSTFWAVSEGSCQVSRFQMHVPTPLGGGTMTQLFPHGAALFLTPNFFITEPMRTLDLLQWFKHRSYVPGTYKLVVCHSFRDIMYQLSISRACLRKQKLKEMGDNIDTHSYLEKAGLGFEECNYSIKAYVMFDGMLEAVRATVDKQYQLDYVPDEQESSIVFGDPEIPPGNEKLLVEWFASWSMLRMTLFRKFVVIGTNKPAQMAKIWEVAETDLPRREIIEGTAGQIHMHSTSPTLHLSLTNRPTAVGTDGDRNVIPTSPRARLSTPPQSKIQVAIPPEVRSLGPLERPQLGSIYVALRDVVSHNPAPMALMRGDELKVEKWISGPMYLASSFRTGISGQVSAKNLGIVVQPPPAAPADQTAAGFPQKPALSHVQQSTNVVNVDTFTATSKASGTAIRSFVYITGASERTAAGCLVEADNDIQKAVQIYFRDLDNSRDIPGVGRTGQSQRSIEEQIRSVHEDNNMADRAIILYNASVQDVNAVESTSGDMGRSGIRFSLESVRPSETPQPSKQLKPIMGDGKLSHISKIIDSTPTDNSSVPNRGSRQVPAITKNAMEEIESTGKTSRATTEIEPTTIWYDKMKAEGKGWEHIEVGGWEKCWKIFKIPTGVVASGKV